MMQPPATHEKLELVMYIVAEDMFRFQLFVLEWVQLNNEKTLAVLGL